MKLTIVYKTLILASIALAAVSFSSVETLAQSEDKKDWPFNGTVIEACSCPVFCQCFFNTEPANHSAHGHSEGGGHFCEFNIAFKVNEGNHGQTNLSGAKFWIYGDLGHDFSEMKTDWAVLTFDPSVTEDQRAGILEALPNIYPVEWKSFVLAEDAKVSWKRNKSGAHATLDQGNVAEILLTNSQGNGGKPVVIENLKYWAVPRNDGLVVMPNEIQTLRKGEKAFEHRGTTGFMVTLDITSKDV